MKSSAFASSRNSRSRASANHAGRRSGHASSSGFADNRAIAAVQRSLQPSAQMMAAPEDELLQGKFNGQASPALQLATPDEEELLQGRFEQGQPAALQKKENATGMPDPVKNQMETALQADFSDVRIHADSSAAPKVGALAYTQGSDVHFAPGQFKPDTSSGQELLGHELTHVVQQRQGIVKATTQAAGLPVNDDPGLEKAADIMGKKAARTRLD